jgi:hypothetical protein
MICLVAANATASISKMIATSIVSVLAFAAFLAWMMLRTVRRAERTERDPKYLRRRLNSLGHVIRRLCGSSSCGGCDWKPAKGYAPRVADTGIDRLAFLPNGPRSENPTESFLISMNSTLKSLSRFAIVSSRLYSRPRRLAFFARAPIPQELPRINPQLVVIVEMKLDRVFAHAFR